MHHDPPADAVGQRAAGLDQRRLEAAHEPVVAVLAELVAALALDRQLDLAAAPAADLELDPVGDGQGHAQAVVAGAEVGRRGRRLDGDPSTIELRRASARPSTLLRPAERDGDRAERRRRLDDAGHLALGRVRILEAVAGQDRDDRRVRVEPAVGRHAAQTPATLAAEAGSQNTPSRRARSRYAARISSSVTASIRPPLSSRAAMASSHDAGSPIRMAVATVSGPLDPPAVDERRGAGGLEAPHRAASRAITPGVRVGPEARPVGADVAGVADRDGQDVRGAAEVVADLERGRLLAVEAERVDRVDQGDRVVVLLGQPADDVERLVEVAVDGDDPGAGDERLEQLAERRSGPWAG